MHIIHIIIMSPGLRSMYSLASTVRTGQAVRAPATGWQEGRQQAPAARRPLLLAGVLAVGQAEYTYTATSSARCYIQPPAG